MRFLILKETPLALATSILGVICLLMAVILFNGELYVAAAVSVVLAILFYVIAVRSQNKAAKRRLETEREYAQKRFTLSEEDKKEI